MFNLEMGKKATVSQTKKMKTTMLTLAGKDELDNAMTNVTKNVQELTSKVNDEYVSVAQMEEEVEKASVSLSNDFITKKVYEIDYKRTETAMSDMRVVERKAVQGVNDLNDYVEGLKRNLNKKADLKMMDQLAT